MESVTITLNQDCFKSGGVDLPISYGCYIVFVKTDDDTGATGTFIVSGNKLRGFAVSRETSTPGENGESVTISSRNGKVQLKLLNEPMRLVDDEAKIIRRFQDGTEEEVDTEKIWRTATTYEFKYRVSWIGI